MSSPKPLRVAFFGTPELSVPTLDALIASRHEVVAVVSQPDRGRGRGRKLSPSPVSKRALDAGLPLFRPERVGDPDILEGLSQCAPDLGVVVAFGQFLGRRLRELPALGYMINAHASLLPKHRGAAPIAQAILDGDLETGISIMRIEREMDAGPVGQILRTQIHERENSAELAVRLSQLAAQGIVEALDSIVLNEIKWVEQDSAHASVAPKLSKEEGRLDWAQSTHTLIRRIHGLAPRPGAFTEYAEGDESPLVLRILRAQAAHDSPRGSEAPGTLRIVPDAPEPQRLQVATGDGWLIPLEVQRAGAKAMPTASFLRGHPLPDGMIFGRSELSNG